MRGAALVVALTALVAQGQAVEVRAATLVLPSGDVRQVDGGVYVPEPEFTAYVRACVACQAEGAHRREHPTPTAGATTVAVLVTSVVAFGLGFGVAAFALRAP